MRPSRAQPRGFTLVETMAVVVMIGILSTLAVYGVKKYINSAKTSEARQMILSIKAGEEAYREETYRYLGTAATITSTTTLYPHVCLGLSPGTMKVAWEQTSSSCTAATAMRELGVTTTAPVQYGYAVALASSGSMPSLPSTSTYSWGSSSSVNGPAFAVVARGDLNGDGKFSVFVSSSLSDDIHVDDEIE